MPVDVFAADEQTDRPVELAGLTNLVRVVLDARGVRGEAEVSVLFVDEPSIAVLNEQFLGRTGSTDVLAFPLEDEPLAVGRSPDMGGRGPGPEGPGSGGETDPPMLLGDVVVCPAVAARNAVEHGSTYQDEIELLIVHGVLHLLGMDHDVEAEAEAMERLEAELLDLFHRKDG